MKKIISLIALLLVTGCATSTKSSYKELRFFHDRNRGNVKFVCWRTADVGWQCSRDAKLIGFRGVLASESR